MKGRVKTALIVVSLILLAATATAQQSGEDKGFIGNAVDAVTGFFSGSDSPNQDVDPDMVDTPGDGEGDDGDDDEGDNGDRCSQGYRWCEGESSCVPIQDWNSEDCEIDDDSNEGESQIILKNAKVPEFIRKDENSALKIPISLKNKKSGNGQVTVNVRFNGEIRERTVDLDGDSSKTTDIYFAVPENSGDYPVKVNVNGFQEYTAEKRVEIIGKNENPSERCEDGKVFCEADQKCYNPQRHQLVCEDNQNQEEEFNLVKDKGFLNSSSESDSVSVWLERDNERVNSGLIDWNVTDSDDLEAGETKELKNSDIDISGKSFFYTGEKGKSGTIAFALNPLVDGPEGEGCSWGYFQTNEGYCGYIQVTGDGELKINSIDAPDSVKLGNSFEFSVEIENTAEQRSDFQAFTARFGEQKHKFTYPDAPQTIEAGETEILRGRIDQVCTEGTEDLSVYGQDDSMSKPITVNSDGNIDIRQIGRCIDTSWSLDKQNGKITFSYSLPGLTNVNTGNLDLKNTEGNGSASESGRSMNINFDKDGLIQNKCGEGTTDRIVDYRIYLEDSEGNLAPGPQGWDANLGINCEERSLYGLDGVPIYGGGGDDGNEGGNDNEGGNSESDIEIEVVDMENPIDGGESLNAEMKVTNNKDSDTQVEVFGKWAESSEETVKTRTVSSDESRIFEIKLDTGIRTGKYDIKLGTKSGETVERNVNIFNPLKGLNTERIVEDYEDTLVKYDKNEDGKIKIFDALRADNSDAEEVEVYALLEINEREVNYKNYLEESESEEKEDKDQKGNKGDQKNDEKEETEGSEEDENNEETNEGTEDEPSEENNEEQEGDSSEENDERQNEGENQNGENEEDQEEQNNEESEKEESAVSSFNVPEKVEKGDTFTVSAELGQEKADAGYKIVVESPDGEKIKEKKYSSRSAEMEITTTNEMSAGEYSVKIKPSGGVVEAVASLLTGSKLIDQKSFNMISKGTDKWESYCLEKGYEGKSLDCMENEIRPKFFEGSVEGDKEIAESVCDWYGDVEGREYSYSTQETKCVN